MDIRNKNEFDKDKRATFAYVRYVKLRDMCTTCFDP